MATYTERTEVPAHLHRTASPPEGWPRQDKCKLLSWFAYSSRFTTPFANPRHAIFSLPFYLSLMSHLLCSSRVESHSCLATELRQVITLNFQHFLQKCTSLVDVIHHRIQQEGLYSELTAARHSGIHR